MKLVIVMLFMNVDSQNFLNSGFGIFHELCCRCKGQLNQRSNENHMF